MGRSSCEGKKKKKKPSSKDGKKKRKSRTKRRGRSISSKDDSKQRNSSNSNSCERMITELEQEQEDKEKMSSEALKLRINEGKTHRKSRGSTPTRTSRSSRISLRSSNHSTSKHNSTEAHLKLRIEEMVNDLNNLRSKEKEMQNNTISVPNELLDRSRDDDFNDSVSTLGTVSSTLSTRSKPGSREFNQEIASKLHTHRKSLCIQDAPGFEDNAHGNNNDDVVVKSEVDDFVAAFDPTDMRCLALVSHNEMKTTMKNFVIKYKNVLKKFRLTGTNSTMKMLEQVFEGDNSVVFGPACSSGPLGGDAELVAMMAQGQLGGILFFQDPMSSHPHQCDIECLVRQALVHNTVIATTPTTAMTIMEVFKMALMGNGRPELLPSFFFSLQSPTVESYKKGQAKVIENRTS